MGDGITVENSYYEYAHENNIGRAYIEKVDTELVETIVDSLK